MDGLTSRGQRSCTQLDLTAIQWHQRMPLSLCLFVAICACNGRPRAAPTVPYDLPEVSGRSLTADAAPDFDDTETPTVSDAADADWTSCASQTDLSTVDAEILADSAGPALQNGLVCGLGKVVVQGQCVAAKFPTVMVHFPAKKFMQGCRADIDECEPSELPLHRVALSAFLLERFEVTAGQYAACVQAGKCSAPTEINTAAYCSEISYGAMCTYGSTDLDGLPMNCLTRDAAADYCKAMVPGGSLPTEAQFERATRTECVGGKDEILTSRFPWGNSLPPPPASHNLCDESFKSKFKSVQPIPGYQDGAACLAPPGSYCKVAGCACDLVGNAIEFVADTFDPNAYSQIGDDALDPIVVLPAGQVMVRGGAFTAGVPAHILSFAHRQPASSTTIYVDVGFRCASNWQGK